MSIHISANQSGTLGSKPFSEGKMSARLFFWAVTSALAGFLFGFDTVVISGAEKTIQALWGLSAGEHGLAMGAALYGTILGSVLGGWPTDRLGRRTLLTIGSFGYIASLGLCSWAFYTGHFAIVTACIFAFIAAHAIGQGTVIWVLCSEIFPGQFGAKGQSLGSATHWVVAAALTTAFPKMVEFSGAEKEPRLAWTIFLFFCFMMVLQLLWVKTMVPETKGRSLEEIQKLLGIKN